MKKEFGIGDLSKNEIQVLLEIIKNSQACITGEEFEKNIISPLGKITSFGVWASTLIFHNDERNVVDALNFSNFDPEWLEEYYKKTYVKIDPVANTCLTRTGQIHKWEDVYADVTSSIGKEFIKSSGDFFEYAGLGIGHKNPDKREILIFILTNGCDTKDPRNKFILEMLAPHLRTAMANIQRKENEDLLSDTQIRILELIEDGQKADRIAQELGLSRRTISYHLDKIKEKVDASNIPSAIAQAHSLRVLEIY